MSKKTTRGDGGSTSYYELPEGATELRHLIKHKRMEHGIGEVKFNNTDDIIIELFKLGILTFVNNDTRSSNIGHSNYASHIIQPWSIIQDWNLNYWDGDIIKRVLRTKKGESRKLDYEKIIHICQERIRQIEISELTEES